MSMDRFTVLIHDDDTVEKVGVSTGKMKLLAMNERTGYLAIHTAGHTYWASMMEPRKYAPATVTVYKMLGAVKIDERRGRRVRVVPVEGLFGILEWETGKKKT